MSRLLLFPFALLFPIVAVIPVSDQKPRPRLNRSPSIESFTSTLTTIEICPFGPGKLFRQPEVELFVNATDPDGDTLSYKYSTNEGIISGVGQLVVWDLRGLPRGPHKVRVTVRDGKGGKADRDLTVTTIDSGTCDPPPPPCPVIKVSCSDEMDKSMPFKFSALIEGDVKGYRSPSFHWKVNAGKIVRGQNSREIEVTAKGANGFDGITAIVEVGGFHPACITTVACTTRISRPSGQLPGILFVRPLAGICNHQDDRNALRGARREFL